MLLEYFQRAALELRIPLKMFSVESNYKVPIASIATILEGPQFKSPEFPDFLKTQVDCHNIDLVIPLMDSACTVLSGLKDELNCHAVVSSHKLCRTMEDKILANEWFLSNNVPVPTFGKLPCHPQIAKSRYGFGSRDQVIIRDWDDFKHFDSKHHPPNYILQPYIEGATEYTVDCYVTRKGEVISILSRVRVEVEAGEVMVSRTEYHEEINRLSREILSHPGFEGPVCLQFLVKGDDVYCVEVNPRFGGGSTLSIHCGQNFPKWIMQEELGLPIEVPEWKSGVTMTRARRDVYFD